LYPAILLYLRIVGAPNYISKLFAGSDLNFDWQSRSWSPVYSLMQLDVIMAVCQESVINMRSRAVRTIRSHYEVKLVTSADAKHNIICRFLSAPVGLQICHTS